MAVRRHEANLGAIHWATRSINGTPLGPEDRVTQKE
jgi:hypothetical protein